MLKLLRTLPVILIASLTVGPVSAATTSVLNQTIAQASASTQATVSVSGTVTDTAGAVVSGATVSLIGPKRYQAKTDALGKFAISDAQPGLYDLTVSHPGYTATTQSGFVVAPAQVTQVSVTLQQQTFSSLKEIGSVTSRSGGAFNTSAASVSNIAAQTFINNANPGVAKSLDQLPGISVEHPGGTADASSPGGVTFPSIRGSLGFETASLIDGHPLANGAFGDFVTTFLNSYAFQSAELVKGPGASSPVVNYAIGGTINFRTKDPTTLPTGNITFGSDGTGGFLNNFGYFGSTANGKLGWALDYANYGTPGLLHNESKPWDLSGVSASGAPIGFTTNPIAGSATNGIQNNPFQATSSLIACCFHVNTTYVSHSELAKVRYKFSGATAATLSYYGTQAYSDQNGNHVYGISQLFTPCSKSGAAAACPGYTNPGYANGSSYTVWQKVFAPENEWETDSEPLFQAELHTTFRNDSILARYYGASISRLQFNGLENPLQSYTTSYALYGTTGRPSGLGSNATPYNGQVTPVVFPGGAYYCISNPALPFSWVTNPNKINPAGPLNPICPSGKAALPGGGTYFRSMEEDHVQGLGFRYDHPVGDNGDLLTVSYDTNSSRSHTYSYLNDPTGPPLIPDGSRTRFGTLLARGTFNFGKNWQAQLSNYFNSYYQRYSTDGGTTFQDFNDSHYDGRLGVTFRPDRNTAYRFAMGSAIAPPYQGLLNTTPSLPGPARPGQTFYTDKTTNGTIVPETSFGYDFGADYRMGASGASTLSLDLYTTTLYNQFVQNAIYKVCTSYSQPTQTCIDPVNVVAGPGVLPLYTTSNFNLSNAKYAGIEMQYRYDPLIGFGGEVSANLVRAYPYNLPRNFYCSTPAQPALCTVPNTNLGIIAGSNFYPAGESGSPGSYNVLQSGGSHAIPYSQGYAEAHYNWRRGTYASLGAQYYGHNNSFNVPGFFVMNATFRLPLTSDRSTFLQLTGNNLTNAYPNAYITQAAGVPVPLANGKIGLTNQNSLGPATLLILLSKNFDFGHKGP
ncbi:MAG: carboxypeptidase regulatory-like domain-containing protein [Candidatus Baltobacteraceae bacterium]